MYYISFVHSDLCSHWTVWAFAIWGQNATVNIAELTWIIDSYWFSLQTPNLQHYSTYSEEDLLPCVRKIAWLVANMNSAKQQAVKTKYSSSKFQRVAKAAVLQRQTIMDLAKAAV